MNFTTDFEVGLKLIQNTKGNKRSVSRTPHMCSKTLIYSYMSQSCYNVAKAGRIYDWDQCYYGMSFETNQ